MLSTVFFGTPQFAATILQSVITAGYIPRTVITMPDRPVGRGRKISPSAVKLLAQVHNIALMQPVSLFANDQIHRVLAQADIAIVVAYGNLIPAKLIELPRYGCINVHASLLPKWRGAAPIERAILAGDTTTGISIMRIAEQLDSGDVFLTSHHDITANVTAGELRQQLAQTGSKALLSVLAQLPTMHAQEQNHTLATYAHKIRKSDARINWNGSVDYITRQIRAMNPSPVAWTERHGQRIRIWQAGIANRAIHSTFGIIVKSDNQGIDVSCADGTLRIQQLQLAGGKTLDSASILRGRKNMFAVGNKFG